MSDASFHQVCQALGPPVDLVALRALLDAGAPLVQSRSGSAPTVAFHITTASQCTAIPLLNQAGLDWSVLDENGFAALESALYRHANPNPKEPQEDWLPVAMLTAGAKPRPPSQNGCLWCVAAMRGTSVEGLDALAQSGLAWDHLSKPQASTPLHFMAVGTSIMNRRRVAEDLPDAVQWFLDHGVDINALDEHQQTVLAYLDKQPYSDRRQAMRTSIEAHVLNQDVPSTPSPGLQRRRL